MNTWIKTPSFLLMAVTFLSTLLYVTTYVVTKKISSEHVVYKNIGKTVVKIWEYFRMFDKGAYLKNKAILEGEVKKLGQGEGYKETNQILWIMTVVTTVLTFIYTLYLLS